MTFPDSDDSIRNSCQMNGPGLVNAALRTALKKAVHSGRLTIGAYDCAKLLESDPSGVTLCVLPVITDSSDVTVVIQHTLMEAFCWEYTIPLLKVDSALILSDMVSEGSPGEDENGNSSRQGLKGVNCVLLQSPFKGASPAEKILFEFYHKIVHSNATSWPVIELQV